MKKRAIAATLAGGLLAITVAGGAVDSRAATTVTERCPDPMPIGRSPRHWKRRAPRRRMPSSATPRNGATWEVEVTKPDGSTVDVRLDANMKVVVVEPDQEAHTDR